MSLIARLGDWTEATVTSNSFCPTGQGGGVDPTCSPSAHAAVRTALDALGVPHAHLSDADLHSTLLRTLTPRAERARDTGTSTRVKSASDDLARVKAGVDADAAGWADRGGFMDHAREHVARVTKGMSSEEIKSLASKFAGVNVRGRTDALMELAGKVAELPRMHASQRV